MAEKSEDTTTLRFIDRNGTQEETVVDNQARMKISAAGAVVWDGRTYVHTGLRTELEGGRPHSVLTLAEIIVVNMSDLE